MLTLRPYQQEAIDAVYRHLRGREDHPCIVIPTAGGKTPILASICRDTVSLWQGRVLVLAHVKELLEQAVEKLQMMATDLLLHVGVYSAGLGSRDTQHPILIAGIQSVYKRAAELGHFDLVVIDEVHMVPAEGDGMYRTLIAGLKQINPAIRLIGLTATPYRMSSGAICTPENILNYVCYEIGVRELIVQGYLCPLVSKAGKDKADTSGLHIRCGEFIAGEVEALMDQQNLVESACREIIEYTRHRHSCLLFASGVKHGRHVMQMLERLGQQSATIFGDTLDFERQKTIEQFKAGTLKYLINVNVLTTGFDAPNIDCIVLLRPTMSPGLFYQMCGRGFRIDPSKQNCLVLDYGNNVVRHGPVDALRIENGRPSNTAPAKECPECHSLIGTGYSVCPDCGYEFFQQPRERQPKHTASAGSEGILSGEVTMTDYPVRSVYYSVHVKRDNPDGPRSMRVEYEIGWQRTVSEWICFEHTGFARHKAELWWKRRCRLPVPNSAEDAVALADSEALAKTKSITVRRVTGEKYDRITGYELDETLHYREPGWDEEDVVGVSDSHESPLNMEDVPF